MECSEGRHVGIEPIPSNSCFLRPKISKIEFFFSVSAGGPQRKLSRNTSISDAIRKFSILSVKEEVHLLTSRF